MATFGLPLWPAGLQLVSAVPDPTVGRGRHCPGDVPGGLDAVGKFHRNHPEDTFSGWLWTITRSKICDHFRRRRAEALVQGGTDAQQRMLQVPDIEPESLTDETRHFREGGFMRRRLELVRAEFEDRTWKAFWRSAVDGQRAADVAEELHMTPAGVYKAKSRVIRRLREELDGLLDE
jgi:RNA polymerase sigma-70 factor (ECF subfamily)